MLTKNGKRRRGYTTDPAPSKNAEECA